MILPLRGEGLNGLRISALDSTEYLSSAFRYVTIQWISCESKERRGSGLLFNIDLAAFQAVSSSQIGKSRKAGTGWWKVMTEEEGLFNSIRRFPEQRAERSRFEADVWGKYGSRCAMLVLDSSGFTRNTQESGILSYLACIVRLRDMMKPILTRSDCISWRAETDNIFAEFETVEGALETALEIHRSVRAANIQIQNSERFGVCIGIGFGDVLRSRSEGVFGNEMNLASKLGEDLAGNGEVLLTESAYQEISEEHRGDIIARKTNISGVELPYYIISEFRT